jgi:hypothetical protein
MNSYGPICAVCNKPVALTLSESNEHGQAVHSECAVRSTDRQGPRDLREEKGFASKGSTQAVR